MDTYSVFLGSMTGETVPVENDAAWMQRMLDKYNTSAVPALSFLPFFDAVEHVQEDWLFEHNEDAVICRDPTTNCGKFINLFKQMNFYKTPTTQVKWNVWGKSSTFSSSTFAHWVV